MKRFCWLALGLSLAACSSAPLKSPETVEAEQRRTWIGRSEDDLLRMRGKPSGGEQLLNDNRLHIYRTEKKPSPQQSGHGMGMMGVWGFWSDGGPGAGSPRGEVRWCEIRYEVSRETDKIVAVFVQGNGCDE
jgi:hypothetical protein